MATIKLAEYTFDNTLADCYPLIVPSNVTVTKEDTVDGNITTRILSTESETPVTKIQFAVGSINHKSSLLTVEYLNMKNITDMSNTFNYCQKVSYINTDGWGVNNVTTFEGCFSECYNLANINVANINVSKAENVCKMFHACTSLTELDLSSWNTGSCKNMSSMFANCRKLQSLDLSSFNTSNVTNMTSMFDGCSSLTSLDLSSFNTSNVTNMFGTFAFCNSLQTLDLSSFDMSSVTNSSYMFQNCLKLKDVGVLYCNAETINKVVSALKTYNTINNNFYYLDTNATQLTPVDGVTFIKYQENILYLPPSTTLRSNGDVRDEYNPFTSQFTQRISEDGSILSSPVTTTIKSIVAYNDTVKYGYELPNKTTDLFHPEAQKYEQVIDLGTLNGTENWTKVNQYVFTVPFTNAKANTSTDVLTQKDQVESVSIDGSTLTITFKSDSYVGGNNIAVNALKIWLQSNNVQFKYELKNHILTDMTLEEFDFENAHFVKPQAYKGGVVTQSNKDNLIFTPITYQTKSNNRYELPLLESNSEYTLRYEGSANQVTLGGSTNSSIENNCLVQSGSSNKVVLFNDEVSNVMLIKDDVREQTFPYFKGLLSVVNPIVKTFSDDKSNILSCNEEVILRSNGDIYDELDLLTGQLIQRIDENNQVLSQEIIKTVNLSIVDQDNQPLEQMNYFTDYYGEIKSDGTLPRFTYRLESTNTFAVPQLKPNTLYTMYSEGEATVATLGGKASILLQNPQTVTSGSANKSLTFDSATSRVILIESNVRNQVIPYFTGTLDVINPIIKTTAGNKSNTVNTNVKLRSVGDVRDTYDLKTGILTKRISDDYTILDNPQTQTISVTKPVSYNGATVELSSNTTSLLPYFEYSCKSPNYYQAPIESGEIYTVKFNKTSNGTLTMGGVTANTTGNQVITTKNSDVKAILFSGDLGISDLMIMKTDVRNVPTPYFRGLKDVVNPTITVSDGNGISNSVSITVTMRSLPNGTKDELNLVTGEFVQRVGQRNYEDGDSNGPSMITDGIATLYQLPTVKRSNLSLSWSNGVLTAYDGSTIITSEAELLKPHLYFRIPTSTLEELVSILEEKNANLTSQMVDLEAENLMTMVALAEVYETMMNAPMTTSSTSSNTKDILMTAMVGVYAKLVTAGVKTIDEVPEHLQINVTKLLKK